MTDGRWNGTTSGGSQDDNTKNVKVPFGDPGGTVYGSTTPADRPKTNLYADTHSNTLADWAFKSWADPLKKSGLTGSVEPTRDYRRAPAEENFGKDKDGQDAILPRFWNPKYNPATWPHMVTYTIGFSQQAYSWNYSNIKAPTEMVPFGWDGSIPDLINGKVGWPSLTASTESRNALDLWHAALNGRGRFYAVEKGEDLEKAFREIFKQISVEVEPRKTSTATSGVNISRSSVGRFTGGYEPEQAWKGFISAQSVGECPDDTTCSNDPSAGWNDETTADKLDALTGTQLQGRLVLSWNDESNKGVPFKWSELSDTQKEKLGKDEDDDDATTANKGVNVLNYVRGDRNLEPPKPTDYPNVDPQYTEARPMRMRLSRQGAIVNSVVWYTGAPAGLLRYSGFYDFSQEHKSRTPMLYVGGNDGMLHGFSAANGAEKIAYVPRGVISNLPLLTEPDFNDNHRYFVDGSPMTGDINIGADGSNDWRTILVGTLGAGGKGYFVLDVTAPDTFDSATADALVMLDRTMNHGEQAQICNSDDLSETEKEACRDIGSITAQPVTSDASPMQTVQIARLNNGRPAVILGNGYNSINQRPALLIQYLDKDQELLSIPVTAEPAGSGNADDNGLAAPRLVDLNRDGTPDIVYAGDNFGNLWKFDLSGDSDSAWGVAFNGNPLFTARGPASLGSSGRTTPQPITSAPVVRANNRRQLVDPSNPNGGTIPVGGLMVAFGTGRNVSKDDPSDIAVQSLYSVLDNTRYTNVDNGKRIQVDTTEVQPKALGIGVNAANLAKQTIQESNGGKYGSLAEPDDQFIDPVSKFWNSEYNGWYVDFPAVGERVLKPLEFFDGSNILMVHSQVPAKGSDEIDPNVEGCESTSVDSERQWRTLINIVDGASPLIPLIYANGEALYDSNGYLVVRLEIEGGAVDTLTSGSRIEFVSDECLDDPSLPQCQSPGIPQQALRPSWGQSM